MSIGNFYAEFRTLWHELALYQITKLCCGKNQVKVLEDQHIFEPLGVVNHYETLCSQQTSQDPLPPTRTGYALLQGQESQRRVISQELVTSIH